MKPISEKRAAWLRVAHGLRTTLGRPPSAIEVARAHGRSPRTARDMVNCAIEDGHLVNTPRTSVFVPAGIRVAPLALLDLGLPAVVYLAWALGSDVVPGFHDRQAGLNDRQAGLIPAGELGRIGLAVVSPYLVAERAVAEPVAMLLAQRADAVVVWRDPLLLGRADVVAARRLGIPVSVTQRDMTCGKLTAAVLWTPPCLLPAMPEEDTKRADRLSTADDVRG